ncbi:MAG: DUF2784 domain-containing protein [Gammaproteobacteria bacterium]|nr:DUF2784 domain-containing protein [Gammaproteobacteria bacterium]
MPYLYLADAVVLLHFAFVIFVIAGGLLLFRWKRLVWLHLPALAWGALTEFLHIVCPLTYLENWLRSLAGAAAYRGDFVEHYLLPVLYPANLTAHIQIGLGMLVLAVNGLVYGIWFWRQCSRALARKRQHFGQ